MAELSNARHEEFARGIAEGKTQKAAYMDAFPASKGWKDRTVISRASELNKVEEVAERVKELQRQSTSAKVLTITQRKELLTELALNTDENTANRIKALDILNKMDSAYVENVNVNGNINNPLSGMSTDELRELVKADG